MTESPDQIKFGTDGWRAIIAREFTFANLARVAQAYANYLIANAAQPHLEQLVNVGQNSKEEAQDPQFASVINKAVTSNWPLVIIGFDRRFLSERFARSAAEIMAGNHFRVALFSEAQPTPLISWAVKELAAVGGIVITASHNPPEFNGFKIKAPWGGSATSETTGAVEKLVDAKPPKRGEIGDEGQQLIEPCMTSYRRQISSYIDLEKVRSATGTVIVDPIAIRCSEASTPSQ